jgi:AcrR family transcriptional regulator
MQLAEPTERPIGTVRSPRLHEIVAAALAILDEEGPDALTMRRLAEDLGMRAPSLYKHVRDKGALQAALIEDIFFELGDALHAALVRPGRQGVVASVLRTYRRLSLVHPNRYRLATSGRLPRHLLPECLEEWAGQPFYFAAASDPYRAQALWSLAHGMVILEIDGRYPEDSDLDRTWAAAAAAFTTAGGPG